MKFYFFLTQKTTNRFTTTRTTTSNTTVTVSRSSIKQNQRYIQTFLETVYYGHNIHKINIIDV